MEGFILILFEGLCFIHQIRTFENLAQIDVYKGNPSQSSQYLNKWGPDKAVDGQLQGTGPTGEDTCSFTLGNPNEPKTRAWWKFPLQILSNVAYLQIYLRSTTVNRHVGFSVYLFNDSSFVPPSNDSGYQVFTQDTTTCPDRVMNITINKLTQGIALYISKEPPLNTSCSDYTTYATIEVCEVKVFGCFHTNFGQGCNLCDSKCSNNQCDAFSGSCIYGCNNPRKTPPECSDCIPGFFGPDCNQNCGQCKNGTICDSTQGLCPEGCKPHWNGSLCDKCKNGFYGQDCSQECGNCNTGTFCNNITGDCEDGCRQNWNGSKCDVCQNGFYDVDCNAECGKCKTGTFCNKTNGDCPTGCQENWQGSKCDDCIPGFFGRDCDQNCGQCKNGTICNSTQGLCPEGCRPNWNGSLCDKCENEFYGQDCSQECGNCKTGTFCNNITGDCEDGCRQNWNGSKCDVCQNGFYKVDCNAECGKCKTGTFCNTTNGDCPTGCQENWQGSKCDESISKNNQEKESETGKIVGTVVGSITVCAVGIVLFIFYKRRRRYKHSEKPDKAFSQPHEMKTEIERKGPDSGYANIFNNTLSNASLASNTSKSRLDSEQTMEESGYYNTMDTCTDIQVNELQRVIVEKLKGEPNLFCKEYKRLPIGDPKRCKAGQLPENTNKNRFKTTFPYDHSRVVLKEKWKDSDGDYINANYIKNYQDENRYIAAQGPKSKTLLEFWRLIWQENIECIVMLTNLIEIGKNKCTKYWPDEGETLEVGHCRLSLLEEVKYAFFTLRKLCVQRTDSSNKREITQLHYTSWPDHGTPEELGLVQFHRAVIKRYKPVSPLLVHCSAGVGRTGTFLGYDSLLRQGKETGRINVFEFVKIMREDRMSMVQTQEQYIFLHKALVCGFLRDESSIQRDNMDTKIRQLLTDDSPQNQQTVYKEFKLLTTLNPENRKNWKENGKHTDSKPNAADDKYRAYLTSYVKGRSDFINAVIVPSFMDLKGFIITHNPLPETEIDVWRLCIDHDVDVMVVLESNEGTSWLPKPGTSRVCTPYKITVHDTGNNIRGISQEDIQILSEGNARDIRVYKITNENQERLLDGVQLLLEKDMRSNLKTLVMSKNGAGSAGVFIVLHNALQQLRVDREVDVFSTVRQIKSRRPEVIANLEQYIFLHKALVCGFLGDETSIQRNIMDIKIRQLLTDDSPQNQQSLYKEFKLLSTLKPESRKNSEDGKHTDSKPNAADDKYRAYLTSYVKGRSDFINAVIVPSFLDSKGFIITHNPLPETEIDVWRLCMDHDVDVMVVLASNVETRWLPKPGTSRVCTPYKITTHDTGNNIRGVIQEDIQILSEVDTKMNRETHEIFEYIKLRTKIKNVYLRGFQLVLEKDMRSNLKTLVMSKNGAGSAGVFIVLHNALQQLRVDGEVDVFNTVRQIKSRKPEIIAKLEEYRSCYQLLLNSRSDDVYANVYG